MKKLILLVVLLLVACSPVAAFAQGVVQLPEALANAIVALSVFVVGWVFVQIGTRFPIFTKWFGDYVDEVAFALSSALIGVIQNWLNAIPSAWEGVGNIALALLVAALAALGLFRFLGRVGVKSFRA